MKLFEQPLEDIVLGLYEEPTTEKKLADTLTAKYAEIEARINGIFLEKMADIQSDPNIENAEKVTIILSASEELKDYLAQLKTLKNRLVPLAPMLEMEIQKGVEKVTKAQEPALVQRHERQAQALIKRT